MTAVASRVLAALFTLWVPASPLASAQTLPEARAALRSGAYDEATRAFGRILAQDPASSEARRGLVEVLSILGRHGEAEAAAREAPVPGSLANALGEVLLAQGKLDEAQAAFARAAEAEGPDRLSARANLAELLFRRGRVDEALRGFDAFIDVYNGAGGRLSARDLAAVGRAVHALGRRDPALFQDALRAFDEAAGADPGWGEPAVLAGELFLEKYQSPEAQAEFAKVLRGNPRNPRALLGQARALDFDGAGGARERLAAIFEVNPDHVGARVLLARLHVSREQHAQARAEADKALRVDPTSLEALSVVAAAQYLSGDRAGFEGTRRRALTLNPVYSGLDATVSELSVQVRRYRDAVERARAGLALDSADWRAWGLLGMNQLRTGKVAEGRASLERAFGGDPYNPWLKNTLDLLDTFERFETVRTEHFELFLHGTEADLLAPLVSQMAEEAYDSLSARYGAEPPLPVRVELFPSHADFSVRTLGEPGLGALGVSFGSLLVMDSPAARPRGEYNWASTLWHELSHAFHLGMTDHRVPRWFSEGLAVHEQRRAREGWGHQVSIPFLDAFRAGRLKKVSELDDGFMRPEYPEQLIFSYYQASLVFQLIEERHGFPAIRAMLDGYRLGQNTGALLSTVLGTTPAGFDEEFKLYVETRFAGPLKALAPVAEAPGPDAGIGALEDFVRSHPGDLKGRLRLGALLADAERYQEARPHLTEALRMFPEYGGPDTPYLYLAQIHAAQGDPERAAAALARFNALSEFHYDALLKQAELLEGLGRSPEAVGVLAKAVLVYPYEVELHKRLAELASANRDPALAVRARQAVVALKPVDRADAFYRLALAQRDAGDRAGARRSVLRALEVAPNFEPALELLLELRGPGTEAP
ncbi:MAG: tetratricopeptide repeat protein [Longimicrobiales bacterium]|nr:tetratricopeptide repeat protein [Longimicrobiales bacterium]